MVHSASRASSVSGLSNEITYSGHSDTSPGGLASSVTLSEDPGDVGTSAEVQYTGYRFTTALEGHAAFDRAGRLTAREAAIEAATAIAFVGNRATLSRPLSGSFVMIERHDALDGVMVGINPTPGGYAAEADWLARAVVPNLEPYRIGHVVVDAPALPLGLSLGATSFTVLPTYKSGTLISVGEAGTVCMTGILLHYNGEPVSDAIVELFSVEHPHRAPGLLMTNRAGRFSVTGLDPGRYALRRSGEAKASGELVIPSGTRGLYAARIVELP
jgi:outer membrane usher protein